MDGAIEAVAGRTFIGSVKSYCDDKGWGHIDCEITKKMFGRDMFLLRSALEAPSVKTGDLVQFCVAPGRQGPQACNVQPLHGPGGAPLHGPGAPSPAEAVIIESKVASVAGRTFVGTLKKWHGDRGFGHISCKETWEIFGKDMFLLKSMLGGVSAVEGEQLRFSVFAGRSGPEAKNIRLASDLPDDVVVNYDLPPQAFGEAMADVAGITIPQDEKWYLGSVKAFAVDKGFGHIDCEEAAREYGRDIFIPKIALSGIPGGHVNIGDSVRFTVRMQEKGPAVYRFELVAMPGVFQTTLDNGTQAPVRNNVFEQPRYLGVVKTFDETKGWGHIESEGAKRVYGKDIFLLRSELREGMDVAPGNQLEFGVLMSPRGPQARDLCLVDYGPLVNGAIDARTIPY